MSTPEQQRRRAPDPEAILAGLDPEQRAAAEALHGPVVVLAGAGTGKTRAITHRIAHGVLSGEHDPRRSLAVTFTTRAAGQMRGRLAALGVEGVQARTFHSAALRQLRFFWPRVVGGPPPEIVATKARLVAAAASRERVSTDPAVVRDLAAEIEWAKSSQVVPDGYAAAAARAGRSEIGAVGHAAVAKVYAGYEALKAERHQADFEDVLLLTVGMLDDRPDVADEVRAQYRWFTVDEYQDVNPLQQRLLDLWLGERDDLCVVGDAAQTIYTFAGATPSHLLGFRARYPHATEVRLVRSYRCSPQIVSLANAVLGSARGAAAEGRLVLRSEQPDGEAPVVVEHRDEKEEADGVAARIAALVAAGTAPRDIAVLYRVNAASEAYEQALGERGIAVDLRGAERFFDRPEVRQAVTLLRGAARAESGAQGDDLVAAVHAVLGGMGWSPDAATAGTGATGEKWANLARLATLAADLAAERPGVGLDDLVADLTTRAEHAHVPAAEAVTLASLHAAKGLEWPVVFLVGLTDGMLPISYADTPERVEEERRLFYVGVTRAARALTLTWAEARTPGGRRRSRSRFLDDVAGQAGVPASAPRVVRGKGSRGERRRRGPASCRVCGKALVTGEEKALGRCRGCPSSYDEALLERLKAWRKEQAAERGVPAYVVFTDRTLLALAELDHGRTTPWRRDDLLEVSGIGATKLETFGDALLGLLAEG